MACKRVVIVPAYQLQANDFWDIRKALKIEHLLDVFPALRQSLWPQLFGLFLIILQLRKSHSHTSDAGSVETFVS